MANWRKSERISLVGETVLFPNEEQGQFVFGKKVSVFYGRRRRENLHQHEQIQLVLTFEKSAAEVEWQEGSSIRTERLLARHFCFIPPQIRHSCRWTEEAEILILYLDQTAFVEHTKHALVGVISGDFKALYRTDQLLWSLSETLRNQQGQVSTSVTSSFGLNLAARIFDGHKSYSHVDNSSTARLARSTIEKVSAYIDCHLKDQLSVELLARHVGLSAVHFSRLFKQTEGIAPARYIAKRRVEKALELLGSGEFRVAEAACEVGFYDQSHLDRHCRKFFGQPPTFLVKSAQRAS